MFKFWENVLSRELFVVLLAVLTVGIIKPQFGLSQDLAVNISGSTRGYLHSPEATYVSESGTAVVRDSGLGTFHHFPPVDSSPDLAGRYISQDSSVDHLRDIVKIREKFGLSLNLEGFWDNDGEFWFYDSKLAEAPEPVSLHPYSGESRPLQIQGRVKTILAKGDTWNVQKVDGGVFSFKPDSFVGLPDTPSLSLQGELVGMPGNKTYVTRAGDTILVYEKNRVISRRLFEGVRDLDVEDGNVYVLQKSGRVLRTDTGLEGEFIFDFREKIGARKITVSGLTAYLTAPGGVYTVELDKSYSSYFLSSRTIQPLVALEARPGFYQLNRRKRIWLSKNKIEGETADIFISADGENFKLLKWTTDGVERSGRIKNGDLPLAAIQFFQFQRSYWSPDGYLYFFFPEDETVEVYTRRNEIDRRISLDWENFNRLRNSKLIGVDDGWVILSGDFVLPGGDDRRVVVVFDRDGNFKKLLRLREPPANFGKPQLEQPPLRYAGNGYLYKLYDDHIRQYDLDGFARGLIKGVEHPVDLIKSGGNLLVLDRGGDRLKLVSPPDVDRVRYGSAPEIFRIFDCLPVSGEQSLLLGKSRKSTGDKPVLFEYDHSTRRFNEILRPDRGEIKYPYTSKSASRVYFWVGENGTDQLRSIDLEQYGTRVEEFQAQVRGPGVILEDTSTHLLPLSSGTSGDTPFYGVFDVKTGAREKVENSLGVKKLFKGKQGGFFGLKDDDGKSVIYASRLLKNEAGTGVKWQPLRQIFSTRDQLKQLKRVEGEWYAILKDSAGFSRVVRLESSPGEKIGTVEIFESPGELKLLGGKNGFFRLLKKPPGKSGGYLVELHSDTSELYGGLRGTLVSGEPVDLSGISLFSRPGGKILGTESGGYFIVDKLPSGYVSLAPLSVKFKFRYPFWEPVTAGEFGTERSVELHLPQEVPLLERAVENLNEDNLSGALSRLKVFLDMVEKGPYRRFARRLFIQLLLEKKDYSRLLKILKDDPGVLDFRAKVRLLGEDSPALRRKALEFLVDDVQDEVQEFLNYELDVLYYKDEGETMPGRPPLFNLGEDR